MILYRYLNTDTNKLKWDQAKQLSSRLVALEIIHNLKLFAIKSTASSSSH